MITGCVVQRVPVEGLGLIADALKASGIKFELVRPFKGERVPRRLGHRSGLVIMAVAGVVAGEKSGRSVLQIEPADFCV